MTPDTIREMPMSISVIIPTLNEAKCVAETVDDVRQQQPHEIIVVDGGSTDDTSDAASEADQIIHSPRGRAMQMNAGAKHATGSTLLFLHADCTLEPGALAAAEDAIHQKGVAAGCFQMHVPETGMLYRSIDACATLRVRMTGLAYGDQGLFLQRDTFEKLGGFPQLRLMEDVYFSKQLRALGRVVVLSKKIFVSSRRWQRRGVVRQTLRNWTLTALAGVGVHPDRLASFYPVVR